MSPDFYETLAEVEQLLLKDILKAGSPSLRQEAVLAYWRFAEALSMLGGGEETDLGEEEAEHECIGCGACGEDEPTWN